MKTLPKQNVQSLIYAAAALERQISAIFTKQRHSQQE
jgi:hypothetical protein